ncbi:MAG: polyprenyl synthetase family protein [Firmicutes bacterium]|nr:polyprenyl synthetase family protein [Bacillota bacterium]
MALNDFIAEIAQSTEDCLQQILPQPHGQEARLIEAVRYSIFAGGKRLRPALFMATLKAFSKGLEAPEKDYLPFAAALEMIHTYSLIHDDLPAMDNDDLRRGRLTCHKAFDEATAILAGDALLTQAFAAMMSLKKIVSPQRLLDATEEVALFAGLSGMVAGQMIDIAFTGLQVGENELRYMAQQKTSALFNASILSAAHLAGANQLEHKCLRSYSDCLGLSFQIADDILDVTGVQEKLGKPIGSDTKNFKSTFVSLVGKEEARKWAWRAAESSMLALAPLGERAALLLQFPLLMFRRDH